MSKQVQKKNKDTLGVVDIKSREEKYMSASAEDVQSIQWDNSTESTEVSKDVQSLFGSLPKTKDPSLEELKSKMKSKLKTKRNRNDTPGAEALNMLQQSMEEMSLAESQGTEVSETKQKEILSKTQGVLSNLIKAMPASQRKMFEGDSGFAKTLQKLMVEEKPSSTEMPLRERVKRIPLITPLTTTLNKSQKRNKRRRIKNKILLSSLKLAT